MPEWVANDSASCAVIAARLHAQRTVASLAMFGNGAIVFTLVVLLAAPQAMTPPWLFGAGLAAALALAGAERILALRIDLDARLFAWLAQRGAAEADLVPALAALDAALVGLEWMPAGKAERSLPLRLQGARRLLRRHGTVVALQMLLIGELVAGSVALRA